jgi:N-acetylmuramoyl-L-alanine amidase
MVPVRRTGWAAVLWLAGCSPSPAPPPAPLDVARSDSIPGDSTRSAGILPPVPKATGPLALRVAYPPPDALVQASDSSFLFGSVGNGDAKVTVNGAPARVWPNGGWLAWVALPRDSVMRFRIEAATDSERVSLEHSVRWGRWRSSPSQAAVWIDTTSLAPRGMLWWPRDEYLSLSVRASRGAQLRLRLADGTIVPLAPASSREPVSAAVRAFAIGTDGLGTPVVQDRYTGVLRGRAIGPDPGPVIPPPTPVDSLPPLTAIRSGPPDSARSDSTWATVEAIRGTDTARVRWPLQLALLDSVPVPVELDDDPSRLGLSDSITVGRALPEGTYHWFFPTGTRATVSGRANADLRLRLSRSAAAWVAVGEARPAGETAVTPAVVGSVTLAQRADRVTARIPLTRRIPFQITEGDRSVVLRLYGAVGDVNWIRYGGAAPDSLVRRVAWAQPSADEVTLSFELSAPVWGYRARWDRDDLLLELRRPPDLEPGDPLRGRLVAVDPGHPPAGATGPTGLREAEANLAIALELKRLLENAGAKVLMTRTSDTPLELGPRVQLAERANAELLISVHNNALPDGINPLTSNGTSVYYNQPQSIPLARAIQAELVRRLGLRDLGIGRGDLAMVRVTWMPSVLTEGLFIILPDQEAALRNEQGRRLYAAGVVEGVRRFLRERAREE